MFCPKCGSSQVQIQTFQEQSGSTTISKTKSKYKEKRHGCLWWLCIGWWWWMVDLFLWLFLFPIKLIQSITRKKKYVGKSKTKSSTKNDFEYTVLCTCQSCGHSWKNNPQ